MRVFCLILILCASSAYSQESWSPNIKKGSFFLATNSNSFLASTTIYENGSSSRSSEAYAHVQYFFFDRLAIGGLVAVDSTPYFEVGASASYFFLVFGRAAVYAEPEVILEEWQKQNTQTVELSTRVGYDFFLTPDVSLGPSFRYAHRLHARNIRAMDRTRIELMLGIFI